MGNNISSNINEIQNFQLNEKVTLQRMRDVLLPNNRISDIKRRHNIINLADDLNKLGISIKLKNDDGSERSDGDIAKDIKQVASFNVNNVCMIGGVKDGEILKKKIQKLMAHVKIANKYFGSEIRVLKNPLNPKSGMRSFSDICNDLYIVQDTYYKNLMQGTSTLKRELQEEISTLENYLNKFDKNLKVISTDKTLASINNYKQIQSELYNKINSINSSLQKKQEYKMILENIDENLKSAPIKYDEYSFGSSEPLVKSLNVIANISGLQAGIGNTLDFSQSTSSTNGVITSQNIDFNYKSSLSDTEQIIRLFSDYV